MREGDAEFEALREAIDAFAAEQAPHLAAEARAEAMAKVRSILAGAMADSLLDHVGEHLAGSHHDQAEPGRSPRRGSRPRPSSRGATGAPTGGVPEAPKDRTARAADATADPAYYVYGVARASEASLTAEVPGVDPRHQAELIEHGGLAAIASRVSLAEFGEEQLHDNLNDVEWLEDKARAHEAVLDEALSRMTVVPMRLCTIYRTAGQVEDMLSSEHDLLADALRRLEGKTEWGVKVIAEPGAIERSSAASAESATGEEGTRSAGAAYLDRKRREAEIREVADGVAESWAEAVHGRLATVASEALLNPLQNPEVSGHDGEMLLNGVYLVEDRETAAFRRVVDELAEEYRPRGVAVELTGPWPPYNFVKSSIEAAR